MKVGFIYSRIVDLYIQNVLHSVIFMFVMLLMFFLNNHMNDMVFKIYSFRNNVTMPYIVCLLNLHGVHQNA